MLRLQKASPLPSSFINIKRPCDIVAQNYDTQDKQKFTKF